jgi:hypothetical protein
MRVLKEFFAEQAVSWSYKNEQEAQEFISSISSLP